MRPDRAKEMAEEEKKAKKPRSVKKTGAGTGSQTEKQVKDVTKAATEAEGEKGIPKAKRAPKAKKTETPVPPVESEVQADEKPTERQLTIHEKWAKDTVTILKPASETPVEEIATAGETSVEEPVKKTKKAPAKKAVKKKEAAVEAPVETAVETATEAPAETALEEVAPTAAEESQAEAPKKRGRKKKTEELQTLVQDAMKVVDFTTNLITDILTKEKVCERSQLIERVAQLYKQRYGKDADVEFVLNEMLADEDVYLVGDTVSLDAPAEASATAPVEAVAKEAPAPAPVAEPVKKPAAKKAATVEKKDGAKEEKAPTLTRAEKKDAIKKIVREVLQTERKWSELIDLAAQAYQTAYPIPENGNANDVRGRVGSVLHLMQEEKEIVVDGNLVRLSSQETTETQQGGQAVTPAEAPVETPVEAPTPKKQPKTKKEPTVSALNEAAAIENPPVKPENNLSENGEKAVETPVQTALVTTEAAAPAPVYDMTSLFGERRAEKKPAPVKEAVEAAVQEKKEELAKTKPVKTEEKPVTAVKAPEKKVEEKPATTEKKPVERKPAEKQARREIPTRRTVRTGKVDPLKDEFLKRLRSLGGNYFEYYAIYLLERYSRMNGRRLEGLRISGGERDGGIDGELELTDRLGFRETIYVQAKNWEPTDERWYIGETILQQFIGAVAYRQAVEGKQHCRGMFITTSTFTTGAKEMLEKMSDRFVGYDGDELFDTAKECEFGLIKDGKGGWKIDEELLSGKKSFFFML